MWVWVFLYIMFGLLFIPLAWVAKAHASRRTSPNSQLYPSVTVIKPVKGINEFSEENFRSWLSQSYPGKIEFIFSFQDPKDPAIPLAEGLKAQFSLAIIVNEIREGFSGKASNLFYGVANSQSDFLIFSDADTMAPENTVLEIAHRAVRGKSIVSCLPVHTKAEGIWARLYTTVWNSTLLGLWAPAMHIGKAPGVAGGTVGFYREDLAKIGGVLPFANYVAEDLKMGALFKEAGFNFVLGPSIESKVGQFSFKNYWNALMRASFVSWNSENGGKIKSILLYSFACGYAPLLIYGIFGDHGFIAPCLSMLGVRMISLTFFDSLAEKRLRVSLFTLFNDLVAISALIVSLFRRELIWAGVSYQIEGSGRMRRI